eukprot:766850-Hanusia_phi.AAC.5
MSLQGQHDGSAYRSERIVSNFQGDLFREGGKEAVFAEMPSAYLSAESPPRIILNYFLSKSHWHGVQSDIFKHINPVIVSFITSFVFNIARVRGRMDKAGVKGNGGPGWKSIRRIGIDTQSQQACSFKFSEELPSPSLSFSLLLSLHFPAIHSDLCRCSGLFGRVAGRVRARLIGTCTREVEVRCDTHDIEEFKTLSPPFEK